MMISTLKKKLSKAEYERGVYRQQLEAANVRITELEKEIHTEFKEAGEVETVTVSVPACECENLKEKVTALEKENHSLKTQVGLLKAKKKPKPKAKKAPAKK